MGRIKFTPKFMRWLHKKYFWVRVIYQGSGSTFEYFSHILRDIVLLLILPGTGLLIFWGWKGNQAVKEEIPIFIAFGLAPLGILFVLVFLWNVLKTPNRMIQTVERQVTRHNPSRRRSFSSLALRPTTTRTAVVLDEVPLSDVLTVEEVHKVWTKAVGSFHDYVILGFQCESSVTIADCRVHMTTLQVWSKRTNDWFPWMYDNPTFLAWWVYDTPLEGKDAIELPTGSPRICCLVASYQDQGRPFIVTPTKQGHDSYALLPDIYKATCIFEGSGFISVEKTFYFEASYTDPSLPMRQLATLEFIANPADQQEAGS